MPVKKRILLLIAAAAIIAVVLIARTMINQHSENLDYGFHTTVPDAEAAARTKLVQTAEQWLGCKESNGSHKEIIDLYNSHTPLAKDYTVKYEDEWCATFVSAAAIQCGFTDIIPTECGCLRQLELFNDLDSWEEADDYNPLPGDVIYYCWTDTAKSGDCTGWSDHVGIVVGTSGNLIKVIEGNYNEQVAYRYISIDAAGIRGYAVPDYSQLTDE